MRSVISESRSDAFLGVRKGVKSINKLDVATKSVNLIGLLPFTLLASGEVIPNPSRRKVKKSEYLLDSFSTVSGAL